MRLGVPEMAHEMHQSIEAFQAMDRLGLALAAARIFCVVMARRAQRVWNPVEAAMKNLFFVHAIVSWAFGLAFLVTPAALAAAYAVTLNPGTAVIARLFGATLVALGLLSWLVRDLAPSETLHAIFLSDAAAATLLCLVSHTEELDECR